MDFKPTILDKFAVVVDQNIRGIQIGIYSTAFVGLVIAVRSVRPFTKFCSPQSIPESFVRKHVPLRGHVVNVEPPGTLHVDHFPILKLPRRSTKPLPVQVDSVKVLGLGTAWLQTVVSGQNIKFQPVSVEKDVVTCIVTQEKTNKNVGIQIVSLGFGTVEPFHFNKYGENDKLYTRYYKELLAAEDEAEKERNGVWADGQTRSNTKFLVDTAKTNWGTFKDKVKKVRHMLSLSQVKSH